MPLGKGNAGSFTDHPRKVLFRRYWAKPILKFLHDKLGAKLIYLGLPGVKALDILEWKEYLKVIIGFQCENYDNRNQDEESTEAELDELIEILNSLEASTEIDYYSLYVGYIEQVILTGIDDKNVRFNQSEFITVYNLDFCNPLTSPFKGLDHKNRVIKYFKLDVIDKLLKIERERSDVVGGSGFVKFITVNSKFWPDLVGGIDDAHINTYLKNKLNGLDGEIRDIRMLKCYAYYHLQKLFRKYNFHAEFLPVIYYKGSGGFKNEKGNWQDHWLLTFTIIGTPAELNNPEKQFTQNTTDFLEQKFIFINDQKISLYLDKKIEESDVEVNIETLLDQSFSNSLLWDYLQA